MKIINQWLTGHHSHRSKIAAIITVSAMLIFSAATILAGPKGAAGDLYVTSSANNKIIQYDGITGAPVGVFAQAGVNGPTDLAFGPNGNLFIVNWTSSKVTEHDGKTGALIGTFASAGMKFPNSLVFTPWGTLIVSNQSGASIREFDGTTGAFIRVFAKNIGVGVSGLTIGPNGNLFVSDVFNATVREYKADSTFVGIFARGGGLEYAEGLVFGPNGNLFVASQGDFGSFVYEYDGTTGAFIKKITATQGGLSCPVGLTFNSSGHLMVSNWAQAMGTTISEVDVANSTLISTISGGGLVAPYGLKYKPGGDSPILTVSPDPLTAGQTGTFAVTGATPNADSFLAYSLKGLGSTVIPFLNVTIDLKQPKQAGKTIISDGNGMVQWILPIPQNASGLNVWFQMVQNAVKTNVVATSVK